jgi:hypothetical protein
VKPIQCPVPPAWWDGAPATCGACGSYGRIDGGGLVERWYDRDGRELRREETR